MRTKSLVYAYPTSTTAQKYWTSQNAPERAETEGCWSAVIEGEGKQISSFTCANRERAEEYLKSLNVPYCPDFVRSSLNRIGATA